MEFQIGDVTDAATLMRLSPQPDIVVGSGFYELLTDDAAVPASVEMIRAILPDPAVDSSSAIKCRSRNSPTCASSYSMRPDGN